jgi:hypothetical protein
MPHVLATVQLHIKVDALPPDIPGELGGHPDDSVSPISGTEQVAYEMMKRIVEVLPENVYAIVENSTLLEP